VIKRWICFAQSDMRKVWLWSLQA